MAKSHGDINSIGDRDVFLEQEYKYARQAFI